jgi:hypothetical protein
MHSCARFRSRRRHLLLTHRHDRAQGIYFLRPTNEATTTPKNDSAMRESFMSCLTPNPHCTTPSRLDLFDEVGAQRSPSCYLHPVVAQKTFFSWGRVKSSPSSNLGYPDLGFPFEQHEWIETRCNDDAFNKVTTQIRCHHNDWSSQSSVFIDSAPPKLAVETKCGINQI